MQYNSPDSNMVMIVQATVNSTVTLSSMAGECIKNYGVRRME